jgi:hypothetical protein
MHRSIALWLVASAIAVAGRATATVAPLSGGAELTRQVYISASDATGAPVTDLTAADIAVKEGGKDRPVASLQPAVAPMQVAILVDDAGMGTFQSAVAQFLQKSLGRGQFSITLLSPQASMVVDFTEDVAALKGALGRLGPRGRIQPDGDQMLDAIERAAKALRQRKAERPVILALTVAGSQPQSVEPTNVVTAVRASGATLNVVFVTGADLGMVMGDGSRQSGGRVEEAGTREAIVPAAMKIASALQHQFLLTYTLPDGVNPSDRLSVTTSRKGITLTAPSRIAAR